MSENINPKEQPREFWNSKFEGKSDLFGAQPSSFLLQNENYLLKFKEKCQTQPPKALAICDGQGRNGIWLSKLGFEVYANDISEIAVKDAIEIAKKENAKMYHPKVESILTADIGENEFDLIIVIFCQITSNHEELHKKLKKALKPNGLIFLIGFTPEQLKFGFGPPYKEYLYTANDLKKEFEGLEFIHLEEHEEELNEGILKGKAAFVTMIGKKIE